MKRLLLLLTAMSITTTAFAAGVNIGWNDCSVAGQAVRAFACNTNLAAHTLVLSFRAPGGVTAFCGTEDEIVLFSQTPEIPDWWRLRNQTGQLDQCRNGSLSVNGDFVSGPFACADAYAGTVPFSGVVDYTVGYQGNPQLARLLFITAVPSDQAHPLTEDVEYYAAKIVVHSQRTVGTGSCSGCDVPIGLFANSLKVVQNPGVGDFVLSQPDVRQVAGWQGECQYSCGCGPGQCSCSVFCTTPAGRPTWGAIKTLYR